LTESFLDQFAISVLELKAPLVLADCTSRRGLPHGVTLTVFGSVDYVADTQPLALALAEAGFQGIRYRVRHDPEASLVAVGLFGQSGAATGIPVKSTGPIPIDVIEQAEAEFGISVLPATAI
jgi:hypothetical protein